MSLKLIEGTCPAMNGALLKLIRDVTTDVTVVPCKIEDVRPGFKPVTPAKIEVDGVIQEEEGWDIRRWVRRFQDKPGEVNETRDTRKLELVGGFI